MPLLALARREISDSEVPFNGNPVLEDFSGQLCLKLQVYIPCLIEAKSPGLGDF